MKVKTGQIVAVPLRDGTFGLAHVARYNGGAVTAHFAHRAVSPEKLLDGSEEAMKSRLVAIFDVTSNRIYDGFWPVIGHKAPDYPVAMLDMKGRSHTANMSEWFFDAYYGVVPWDAMAATPRCFEDLLLPGVPVPSTARYKRDFDPQAPAASPTSTPDSAKETDSEPRVTQGPGIIHIEIKYPGEDLPSVALLKRRQAIEGGLESAGAGTVIDAGGGGGVMDVYLETADVAHALPFVREAVNAAGFHDDARIEVEPPSDGATEEDAS